MTWPQLWEKYEARVLTEDPSLEGDDLKEKICLLILEKSCCTSEVFNNLAGCRELNTVFGVSACTTVVAGSSGTTTATLARPADHTGDDIDDDDSSSSSCCVLPFSEDVALEAQPAASETDEGLDETKSKALARATAAECAAACAGALRLTRLVKPFVAMKAEAGQGQAEAMAGAEEKQPGRTRRRERQPAAKKSLSRRARHPQASA